METHDDTHKIENNASINFPPKDEKEDQEEPQESPQINIDEKILEFQNKLDLIISLKNEGNIFAKSAIYEDAIEKYSNAKELLVECGSLFAEFLHPLMQNDENLKNLFNSYTKEKVAIFSNLAFIYSKQENYNLSVEHDIKIITGLDYLFDKSHLRLIQSFIKLGKLDNAVYHWVNMKNNFSKETLEKYNEQFENILKENKNFSVALEKYKNFGKGGISSYSRYFMILAFIVFAGAWLYLKYNKQTVVQEEIVV